MKWYERHTVTHEAAVRADGGVEVVRPARQVRHVERHVELWQPNREIRGDALESRDERRERPESYRLREVVEVDGGEAEEVVAAEPADRRHSSFLLAFPRLGAVAAPERGPRRRMWAGAAAALSLSGFV